MTRREALNTIQKPERLIERLILASSSPGDIVLDPFSGVGTCPLVCKKHNREFIAIEINPDFVQIANERLRNLEQSQLSLGI